MFGTVCDEECDEEGKCVMSSVHCRVLCRVCDGECVMESVWRRVCDEEWWSGSSYLFYGQNTCPICISAILIQRDKLGH